MSGLILTLNAGSSSVKFAVFEAAAGALELSAKGQGLCLLTLPIWISSTAR